MVETMNELCKTCKNSCKQAEYVVILRCPEFVIKEIAKKKEDDLGQK